MIEVEKLLEGKVYDLNENIINTFEVGQEYIYYNKDSNAVIQCEVDEDGEEELVDIIGFMVVTEVVDQTKNQWNKRSLGDPFRDIMDGVLRPGELVRFRNAVDNEIVYTLTEDVSDDYGIFMVSENLEDAMSDMNDEFDMDLLREFVKSQEVEELIIEEMGDDDEDEHDDDCDCEHCHSFNDDDSPFEYCFIPMTKLVDYIDRYQDSINYARQCMG
jgi:hypothetical protein